MHYVMLNKLPGEILNILKFVSETSALWQRQIQDFQKVGDTAIVNHLYYV